MPITKSIDNEQFLTIFDVIQLNGRTLSAISQIICDINLIDEDFVRALIFNRNYANENFITKLSSERDGKLMSDSLSALEVGLPTIAYSTIVMLVRELAEQMQCLRKR